MFLRENSSAHTELYNKNGMEVYVTKSGRFEVNCGRTHTYAHSLSDVKEKINSLDLNTFPGSGDEVISDIKKRLGSQYRLEIKSSLDKKDETVFSAEGSKDHLIDKMAGTTGLDINEMKPGTKYSMTNNMYGGQYAVLVPMDSVLPEMSPSFEPQYYEPQPLSKGMVLWGIDPASENVFSVIVDYAFPNGTFRDTASKIWSTDDIELFQLTVGEPSPLEEDFNDPEDSLYDSDDIPSYNPVGDVGDLAPNIQDLKNYDSIMTASAGILSDFMKSAKKSAFIDRSSLNKVKVSGINDEGQATDGEIEWNVRIGSPKYKRSSQITIPMIMTEGSIDLGEEFITSTGQKYPLTVEAIKEHLGDLADDIFSENPKRYNSKFVSTLKADKDVDNLLRGIDKKTSASKKTEDVKDPIWMGVTLNSEDFNSISLIPFNNEMAYQQYKETLEGASDSKVFGIDDYGSATLEEVKEYYSGKYSNVYVEKPNVNIKTVYDKLMKSGSKKNAEYITDYKPGDELYEVTLDMDGMVEPVPLNEDGAVYVSTLEEAVSEYNKLKEDLETNEGLGISKLLVDEGGHVQVVEDVNPSTKTSTKKNLSSEDSDEGLSSSNIMDNLPKDLTLLTDEQHEAVVDYLSNLSLGELRKRQDIVKQQREQALKQGNDQALSNFSIKEQHLISAIDQKEFGKESSKEISAKVEDDYDSIYGQYDDDGNIVLLYESDGTPVTRLDANIYPVGSDLSTRYEHPEGIHITKEDAYKIGLEIKSSKKTAGIIEAETLDELAKAISEEYVVDFDDSYKVQDPGKFEGERIATMYYYDAYMNGDFGEDSFNFGEGGAFYFYEVESKESNLFESDKPYFMLYFTSSGFVHGDFVGEDKLKSVQEEYGSYAEEDFDEYNTDVESSKKTSGEIPGKPDGTGPFYMEGDNPGKGARGQGNSDNCPLKVEDAEESNAITEGSNKLIGLTSDELSDVRDNPREYGLSLDIIKDMSDEDLELFLGSDMYDIVTYEKELTSKKATSNLYDSYFDSDGDIIYKLPFDFSSPRELLSIAKENPELDDFLYLELGTNSGVESRSGNIFWGADVQDFMKKSTNRTYRVNRKGRLMKQKTVQATDTNKIEDIYKKLKDSGVEMESYQSDLYVPVNETTTEILEAYEVKDNVSTFRSDIDGTRWYEIPFGYLPYWEKRTNKRLYSKKIKADEEQPYGAPKAGEYTADVDDIILLAENERQLYDSKLIPMYKNLTRKKKRDVYDPEKAPKLFRYLVDDAANLWYDRMVEWADVDGDVVNKVSKEVKEEAAKEMADRFEDVYENKEYSFMED
jgi:hypothetical protein